MDKKKLQEAKKLADAGDYKAAWKLLFGQKVSAKPQQEVPRMPEPAPSFELVEGDGMSRTLEEAEAYWEERGYEIARLKHFYALAGSLTPEQLKSIRKDCDGVWIISDMLYYDDEDVSINGGAYVKCPVYEGVLLAKVLGTPKGLKLFQALCGTKDGAEAIIKKFVKLSGMKNRKVIRFWTPRMDLRRAYPSWAAGFGYGDGEFLVGGGNLLGSYGHSRGVRER